MKAIFSSWPLNNLGVNKYLLYGPLVARVIYSKPWQERNNILDLCILHILILCSLRGLVYQLWSSFSNMLFLNRRRRIIASGVDFQQIDNEWDWDNFLILDCWIGVIIAYYFYPSIVQLPEWNPKGVIVALLLHIIVSEPLFYWVHRAFHHGYLFDNYHSMHHSSLVPQPFTAGFATPLEHMVLNVVRGLPLFGACMVGSGSIGLIYGHVLLFDFLRCMGHCNVEMLPHELFEALPFLKYLIYTPTYHMVHHMDKNSNFCLFMPLFDALGGTLNTSAWQLNKQITSGKNDRVPDFVFLAHVVDVMTSMHVPFVFRTFASLPYKIQPFLLLMWPGAFVVMLMMWAWSKTFLLSFYHLRGRLHQIWVVPRFGFQYFLPFARDGINEQIEMAILRADTMGVKVLSLAALNKNESLNGGGTLFLKKHPDLKVRLVHGNTLTAGVILHEIPRDCKEVFLTGATSKIGRAIALYLCRKGVRVLMLTFSTERFKKIQMEAWPEFRDNLVLVTKYEAAQNCKTWIVGKWITLKEQSWAPSGTHFHQFVVPPIIGFRKDCTYGKLSAMRLPKDVQGLGMCEYTLDRGVAHACHAGGVVHLLEGWTHHEIGPINVDQIDVVWQAALKHGLQPV